MPSSSSNDVYSLSDNKQLYEILDVPRTATADQIKKSFRQLSLKHHPDRGGETEKFQALAFAYNILSDPEQRARYDNKTLKSHISTEARERDPGMDPSVELEGEQLRSFVERLHNEQMENLRKKAEFERRREQEYSRRAQFDAANPGFKMSATSPLMTSSSSSSSCPASATSGASSSAYSSPFLADALKGHTSSAASASGLPGFGGRTSADMLAALQARMKENHNANAEAAAASPASADMAAKRAMMEKFRHGRETVGISPCVVDDKTKKTLQAAATSHKYEFVKGASRDTYEYELEKIRQRENFNYKHFVQERFHDGGIVKEAILADALGQYDNSKPQVD